MTSVAAMSFNGYRLAHMTNDIDLLLAAKLYIDQHGDQAALQAAMQADALLDAGDMDGAASWRGITKAIEVTPATEAGGARH